MSEFFLSVVVPMYNVQGSVARCLKSVAKAARGCERPVEVVVVDDASEDGSVAAARGVLEGTDLAWSVSMREENSGGGGVPRNDGVEMAHGDFVWFVDADDVVTEDAFGRIAAAVEKFPKADVIALPFTKDFGEGPTGDVKGAWERNVEEVCRGCVAPWSKIVRRSKYVPMPPKMTAEDLVWHFAQMDVVDEMGWVEASDGPVYVYNRASESSVNESFRYMATSLAPLRLDDKELQEKLAAAGRRWWAPADYLRSLAALYELGGSLKRPVVRRWWWSRARKVFAKFHAGTWTY